jgi:hypothetical protein
MAAITATLKNTMRNVRSSSAPTATR